MSGKKVDVLEVMEIAISVFALGLAVVLVVLGVVLRYSIGFSNPVFEEITRYAIIWGMFAASSRLMRHNGHITIDVLLVRLPRAWQAALRTMAMLAGTFFCGLLVVYGAQLVLQSYTLGATSQSSLRVPMWLPQLAVPLGGATLLVRFLQELARQLCDLRLAVTGEPEGGE
ncbi:MAG: TRAP transporter small permease [Proteobacteria bacterium]|nr:TRAP transporter small permease [Pseudomonadota bacterium]